MSLAEYTDEQIVSLRNRHETLKDAAMEIKCDASNLGKRLKRIQSRAESGEMPTIGANLQAPPGYKQKGFSVLTKTENGDPIWQKFMEDKGAMEDIIRETAQCFLEDIAPLPKVKVPKIKTKDLLTCYNIGDAHIGMLAWHEETGEDFNLSIARQDILAAIDRLIDSTPASEECLINQLGDYYHVDNKSNTTPQSGNQLDTDSRFRKMIRVGNDTMRTLIERALEKHKIVRVRNVAGNHDPHAHITLDEFLRGYFSKNQRVIIESSPRPFWAYKFGKNLIGISHGHAPKPEKMPGVLAVDYPEWWAQCDYRYCWHGHIHTKRLFETLSVLVESFRTLATNDEWHTAQGYRSGKEMQAIILDKEYGEVERHTASLMRARNEQKKRS